MPPLEIRPLVADDAAALSSETPTWAAAVPVWSANADGGVSVLLVAWDGSRPVGVVECTREDPPELRNLGVLPEMQGRGIGSALIAAVEQMAACAGGHGRLRIGVDVENIDALRLYRRLGYVETGEVESCTYEYVDASGSSAVATEENILLEKVLPAS